MMLFVSSNEDRLLPRSTQSAIAIMISDKTVDIPNGTAAINWINDLINLASDLNKKMAPTVTSLKRVNSFFIDLLRYE